jgi:peptide/nickel transport system permease protein
MTLQHLDTPAGRPPRYWPRPRAGLALAAAVLALALACALAPGLLTDQSAVDGTGGPPLAAPSAAHLLGTDELGRDLLARIIHGARHTLASAAVAVGVGLLAGGLLGLVAGMAGGWIDALLTRIVDVALAIPSLLLSLSLIVILGFGPVQVAVAVGVTSIATFARLIRSEVLTVRRSDYVEAAFGSGGTFGAVLWRHVLPNSLTAVLGLAAIQSGWAILQISTLGFLGYGAPPPTPEWGLMIAEGRNYMATAWWLTLFPGLAVVAVVLAVNAVGRAFLGDAR